MRSVVLLACLLSGVGLWLAGEGIARTPAVAARAEVPPAVGSPAVLTTTNPVGAPRDDPEPAPVSRPGDAPVPEPAPPPLVGAIADVDGCVLDVHGRLLADAVVECLAPGDAPQAVPVHGGRFALAAPVAGFTLRARAPGCFALVRAFAAPPATPVTLQLAAIPSVRGRVVGVGADVARVRWLRVADLDDPARASAFHAHGRLPAVAPVVEVGADGTFTFRGDAAGYLVLEAETAAAPTVRGPLVRVAPDASPADVVLCLAPGHRVRGRVDAAWATPGTVLHAHLLRVPWRGHAAAGEQVAAQRVAPDGTFAFPPQATGTYRVDVRCEDALLVQSGDLALDGDLDLALLAPAPARLEGRAPARAVFALQRAGGLRSATVAADGTYAFPRLAPGPWVVLAGDDAGAAAAELERRLRAGVQDLWLTAGVTQRHDLR